MKITMKVLIIVSIILVVLSGCIEEGAGTSIKSPGKMKNITKNSTNDSVPPGPISYLKSVRGQSSINWTWENPEDNDFSHVIIFINGKFKTNVTKQKNYYNLTGIVPEKLYSIGIRTVDLNKNVNNYWVNDSTSSLPKFKDTIPPDKVWYLDAKVGNTWINWTWENPEDKDYSYANIYVDGKFATNVSKSKNYYNLTKLSPGVTKTIMIRTVDSNKNINTVSVSNVAMTLP